MTIFFAAALLAAATGAPPQQPAAPPQAAALTGTWTFDPYVSDHPEQIALALRLDTGEGRPGAGRGRGGDGDENGRDAEDRPRGNEGRGREGGTRGRTMSDADRKLLTELTDAVRFPPLRLAIAATGTGIQINRGSGEPEEVHADGKSEKRQLQNGTVNRTAGWDGSRLVVSDEVGAAGTLTHTYEVAPTTGQLVVRVAFAPAAGPGARLEITLVYDGPAAATGPTSPRPRP